MEEKEPIKVSLQTVLLIIAIIVILIMAVAIGVLYNKNTKLENDSNEFGNIAKVESETSVNNSILENTVSNNSANTNTNKTTTGTTTESNSTPSKAGIKLVQFDTDFYKLGDVALEYRECKNINSYKDFEYDLDGDGIITSGEIYGHRAWTEPYVFEYYYKLENNDLKKHNLDISKIKDVSFSADGGLFTTDLKNIDKYNSMFNNAENYNKYGDSEEGQEISYLPISNPPKHRLILLI